MDFNRFREEIASAFNDFGNRQCKPEGVECNALKYGCQWKHPRDYLKDQLYSDIVLVQTVRVHGPI